MVNCTSGFAGTEMNPLVPSLPTSYKDLNCVQVVKEESVGHISKHGLVQVLLKLKKGKEGTKLDDREQANWW